MSKRWYRTMFGSESVPSCCQAAACAYGHRLQLQTGMCMPYGIWLQVATRYIRLAHGAWNCSIRNHEEFRGNQSTTQTCCCREAFSERASRRSFCSALVACFWPAISACVLCTRACSSSCAACKAAACSSASCSAFLQASCSLATCRQQQPLSVLLLTIYAPPCDVNILSAFHAVEMT